MQIVDLSIDLAAASFFHPSLHPFPSFSDVITLHHAVISLFLPTFPSLFSLLITPLQPYSPVKVCVRVCLCVHTAWPMVRGKDCPYYKLLLRDRQMTNSESEWMCVCICVQAFMSAQTYFVFLWARKCACLSIFFHLSICLLGQFAVWGPPQW